MPKLLLHLEGLAVLGLSAYSYSHLGFSWGFFALLFLAPDLSFIGYLGGNKKGAMCYNILHTYLLPITLLLIGHITSNDLLLSISLIWGAHIGMDRMIGYGLKYASSPKDTHLQRV